MECREVQQRLSAYYDDELPGPLRSAVAEHVRSCPRCGGQLSAYQTLSSTARKLAVPQASREVWAGIETKLDRDEGRGLVGVDRENMSFVRSAIEQGRRAERRRFAIWAMAALVLVATGAVLVFIGPRLAPDHHRELAVDFERYLEQFPANPDLAQKVLLAKYSGQPVDVTQATRELGYRPAVVAGLPSRYTLESLHVMKMPCCTCAQAICRRDDGRVLAIFEHHEKQPLWFGGRPEKQMQCNGCSCSVIQADTGVVASWRVNERQITVIGARDLKEITDLVGHLQGSVSKS